MSYRKLQAFVTSLGSCMVLVLSATCLAEEGGSGHYQPGSMSSFADGVSATPMFLTRLNVVNYDGEFDRGKPLPIAGITALNAEAKATAVALGVAWAPEWGKLNDSWQFQMAATVPVLSMKVSADVATSTQRGSATVRRSDTETALGDIVLQPIMFNQNFSPDFNINYRVSLYAPTGSYKLGRLANTGKNYWTIEPMVAFMYFGQKNGREASIYVGADFNEENSDTHYKTGTQVHIDSTFAQHFPLWNGVVGAGVTAYWYQQIKGDSGSGANFGDFKGRTNGVGPVLSYVGQINKRKLVAEFRWMHEYGVENRLSGDTAYVKVMYFL